MSSIAPTFGKQCSTCSDVFSLTGFYKHKDSKDGLQSQCKDCASKYHYKYYRKNRVKIHERTKRWTPTYYKENHILGGFAWIAQRVSQARRRAKQKNIDFDENALRDVLGKCSAGDLCPCLGIELVIGHGHGHPIDGSASVDRIRPELGYVKGNIAVISHRANVIKSSATAEEVKAVSEWMVALGL